jgi:hypothetical protein
MSFVRKEVLRGIKYIATDSSQAANGWPYMSDDPEMSIVPPTAPITRSAAAERMRAHRERRREGLRCLTIQLRETEITELIRRKLLEADARNDLRAVRNALHRHLDASLGA